MKPRDPNRPSKFGSSYRLYGIDLETNFPFTVPLPGAQGAPSMQVVVDRDAGSGADGGQTSLYTPPSVGESPAPLASVHTEGNRTRLHFPAAGDFLLSLDRISYFPRPAADFVLAQSLLLGPVLSVWLEERGRPVLHASTVEVEGSAVAFLAASHGGKTSLAAALVQSGAALMSDDLLAIERLGEQWVSHPAFPQMRMWPEQARRFLGRVTELEPVHASSTKLRVPVGAGFGTFQRGSQPLRVIYLPQRREPTGDLAIHFEPASASASLIELVRHSFLTRMLHYTGRQATRLPILASVARSVQIRRVSYPSGFEQLPAVAAAIIEDVKALQAEPVS